MYAGKTTEFIRRLKRARIAQQKTLIFKPIIDDRYSKKEIVSHDGESFEAIPINRPEQILDNIYEEIDVVGIEEVQFFNESIINIIEILIKSGKRVIAVGLDMDFRGEPFDTTAKLLSKAEYVDKLSGICVKCGDIGTRSQRSIDGKPALYSDPTILVGETDRYTCVCRSCHEVPKTKDEQLNLFD